LWGPTFRKEIIMASFNDFMKSNKKAKEHVMYPATESLTDKNGKPLMWELKPITSKENEEIRESCTMWVQVPGKPGQTRAQLDASKLNARMICASVVNPDLKDTELQNSYGVITPEALVLEMVDDPGEYIKLLQKVQEISGFTSLAEDVEEAKN